MFGFALHLELRSLPGRLPDYDAPPAFAPPSSSSRLYFDTVVAETMAAFFSLLKTVCVPALISLTLYVVITFVILPFLRRYRERYSQYLPLDSISAHTSTLRDRVTSAVMNFILPSSWRRRTVDSGSYGVGSESTFGDEEGEGMVGFDMNDGRREALERRRSTIIDNQARLSRDLEEGFRDDSDDEGDSDHA